MYEKSLVDDIAYQNIVSSLNYQEEFTQICVFAEKIEKEKSISCIFMLSESSFTVFTQKAILKFYSISETRSCFEITRVYSEKDDEFVLFFQNNFSLKFFTSQTKHILEIIVQHVHNILADTEMPEVDLESFDYTILRHSGYSSLMRFRARVFNENFVINNRINDIYMQFLDSKKNLLDLRIFPDVQHVTQLLLDSVNCEPMIDSIQIPNSFSCWSELSYFFKRNTTIKSLIVSQPPDHLFPFFVQSLRNNPLNKLKQIIFVKTRFDEEQIRQLIEFLKRSKIERLGLRESINHHNSALFMNTLSEEIHATNIKSLDFDNTKSGLNLRQLFIGGSRGIEELSVQNCKIQLAEIFEFLDESSIIKKVDMSGNRCEHLIDDKIQISESLEKIKVANILFGEDNFNRLMKVLCKFKGNVNLSRSILDRERWEHLFTSLHQSENCQISVIHWDDNPISLKFLDFLDSCVNLKKLSLSGCFGSDDLIFNDVVEFLK
ncbi:hypothetical protein TRFO_14539 [Tritrichomonas foetus]|uniref:Leucine Rich Repeat family protein n=1 Tax=Tritrichomonas foetus TaxID=1144522 RepID=A0A1J4KVW6_9EUKA|nr:hypothetical protein TRFO_14539 [Tritrichomonas foetus]|eukprot:OHT15032.1 hypothetical protein TRFO_14539 [Tritrichomonas foetus]